jgi:serine-type D-Ala-D-Ala carboxypeptidase/endopeptidase (penicillin-binding protein 4)
MKYVVSILFLSGLFWSCATSKPTPVANARFDAGSEVINSPVFANNHTGFMLYDIAQNQSLAEVNAHKYFMPASNAKLITFFISLKTLGDSLEALKYVVNGDSLIFWGTGDPSLLHPDLQNTQAYQFLKKWKGQLFFSPINATNLSAYGSGWAWDDYNDYYQPDITAMPIYGNIVRFAGKKISPTFFEKNCKKSDKQRDVQRLLTDNIFEIPTNRSADFEQDVPFKTSTELFLKLLSDTLKKEVGLVRKPLPYKALSIKSISADSVYKRMLEVSDNMLAEQLMVMCSGDTLSTSKAITKGLKKHLADLPDAPRWVDGSGLSRYNVISPADFVMILQKIYTIVPQKRLFEIMPVGGRTGTLKPVGSSTDEPFIFAKSGSFSNNYNLSGYLKTKSGKVLIFSFMNNCFMKPIPEIRKEVTRILSKIRDEI